MQLTKHELEIVLIALSRIDDYDVELSLNKSFVPHLQPLAFKIIDHLCSMKPIHPDYINARFAKFNKGVL